MEHEPPIRLRQARWAPCGTFECPTCTPWGYVIGSLGMAPKPLSDLLPDFWDAAIFHAVLPRLQEAGIVEMVSAATPSGTKPIYALTRAFEHAFNEDQGRAFIRVDRLFEYTQPNWALQ